METDSESTAGEGGKRGLKEGDMRGRLEVNLYLCRPSFVKGECKEESKTLREDKKR